MKKILIPIISGVIGIIIPVAGMTITPTRNLILGLAPKEAILQLADKIDETRLNIDQIKTDNDNKIQELQSTIEAQQVKLAEQQKAIDGQNGQINSTKLESQTAQAKVDNETECRKLYSAFDDFIDNEKKNHGASDADIKGYKKTFETCQGIIKKCD
jgi:hypothetical protein